MPSSNGSANGFGADHPNAIPRENGLEISPLTPGKSPRFPNFLKGPSEKKTIKGSINAVKKRFSVLLLISHKTGKSLREEVRSLTANLPRHVDKN